MDELRKLLSRVFPSVGMNISPRHKELSPEDLKNARERLKLSPRELAKSLGVPTETVIEWERKKK